jgi:hypothetical protein
MEMATATSITYDTLNAAIKARLRITAGSYICKKFLFYGLDEVDKTKLITVTEATTNMAFSDVGVLGERKPALAVAFPTVLQVVRELSQTSTAQVFSISGCEEVFVTIEYWL